MNDHTLRQELRNWLRSAEHVTSELARSGFMQEGAEHLFPEMHGNFKSQTGISCLLEAFSQLGNALTEYGISAVPMLIFNLRQTLAATPQCGKVVLSKDIDDFHPPLLYVLPDSLFSLLPMEAEYRFPMELKIPACVAPACTLVATPAEPDYGEGHTIPREWDLDVRLVGLGSDKDVLRRYAPKNAGTVEI